MLEARNKDPVLSTIKRLINDETFEEKSREEQWGVARKLLREEKNKRIQNQRRRP